MYNVIIIQTLTDGNVIRSMANYETRELAGSRFHQELAQVGIADTLKSVACLIVDDDLNTIAIGDEHITESEDDTPTDPAEA